MSRIWARIATLLGALSRAFCLSGCEVRGTVDVSSEQDLAIDVTITGLERGVCSSITNGFTELDVQRGLDTSGQRYCRVRGDTKAAEISGLTIAAAAEYYVLAIDPDGTATSWPLSDLTFRFPGQVIEASHGTVSGSSLHLTDLAPLAAGESLRVVALSRPGPPWWLVAVGVGVVGGALAMLGYQRWAAGRRPETQEASDDEVAPEEPEPVEAAEEVPEPAPIALSDPLFFAPPRVQPAPEMWAAPSTGSSPGQPEAPSTRSPETDHSVWAPPA